MKRKVFGFFGAVSLIGLMAGCAAFNGSTVYQERTITGFEGIVLESSADVNIYPGREYKVFVTTQEKVQNKIVTEVKSNILHIKNNGTFTTKELTIDVYLPELKTVTIKGAGDIKIGNGNSSSLEITISGTGDIDALNFQVEDINITSKGVGDARIWATEILNGTSSGSGDIFYKGNPRMNVKVSGVGDVKSL